MSNHCGGARECGANGRIAGGVYACVPTSEYGLPIEAFLLDPPVKVSLSDLASLGVTDVGVGLVHRGSGVYDLWNIVGTSHYPRVAYWIEEARRMGVSVRAEGVDVSKLTTDSRLILVSRLAWIDNAVKYYANEFTEHSVYDRPCPVEQYRAKSTDPMHTQHAMCARFYWQDMPFPEEDSRVQVLNPSDPLSTAIQSRAVDVHLQSGRFTAYTRPQDVIPDYRAAIFARFPIVRFEVVEDKQGGTHQKKLEAYSRGIIETKLTEE